MARRFIDVALDLEAQAADPAGTPPANHLRMWLTANRTLALRDSAGLTTRAPAGARFSVLGGFDVNLDLDVDGNADRAYRIEGMLRPNGGGDLDVELRPNILTTNMTGYRRDGVSAWAAIPGAGNVIGGVRGNSVGILEGLAIVESGRVRTFKLELENPAAANPIFAKAFITWNVTDGNLTKIRLTSQGFGAGSFLAAYPIPRPPT